MIDKDIFLAVICITLLVLLLIAILVIVFFISGKQRVKQQVEITEMKLSFERELRQVETEVSEQMMVQFAQELHDNIGQLLTAMHLQIESQKLQHPGLSEGFKPIEIYVGEVTQQLRMLSRTLNSDYVGNIGLLAAIQLEVDRLHSLRRFEVHWSPMTGSISLEKNQELVVFRIFQEIIQNALRHSAAKHVYIRAGMQDGRFVMEVRDDGKGFDMERVLQSQKASGLRNITRRATMAGISCEILSSPGNGCTVRLKK